MTDQQDQEGVVEAQVVEEEIPAKPLKKMTRDELIDYCIELQRQVDLLQRQVDAATSPRGPGVSKLSMEIAEDIRTQVANGASKNSMALMYGVSRDTINAIMKNKIYDPDRATRLAEKAAIKEAAKAEKAAAKEVAKEAKMKEAAEKKAAREAQKNAMAAERAKAAAERAAAKEAAADGTGPVAGTKKERKITAAAPAEAKVLSKEERQNIAAEARKAAYARAQAAVAARDAVAALPMAPEDQTGVPSPSETTSE